jgi:hypothetical protein
MRGVHLVGSVPAASADQALDMVIEHVGGRLCPWVPDGETGDRRNWVQRLIEHERSHPDLEVARDGSWTGYEDTPSFRVRPGHRFESVDLDYAEAQAGSWPAFDARRSRLPDGTRLLVGVPGVLDLAMITFGFDPRKSLPHTVPFRDETVRQLVVMAERSRGEVVFQLELPVEVSAVYRAPRPVVKALAAAISREVALVARRGPDVGYGIHLCNGDMNNKALVRPDDLGPLVEFANSLAKAWPSSRRLEFVHLPFARGDEPAPAYPSFYDPLRQLRIPPSTRLAAGFVHEAVSLEGNLAVRSAIEERVAREVDVAAACGLGRRSREQAIANLDLSRQASEAA